MKDVNRQIRKILELEVQVDHLRTKEKELSLQVDEMIKELSKLIMSGDGSTGDKIRDYVIVRYGSVGDSIVEKYRDLEALIRGHVGEFVLVVAKEETVLGGTPPSYQPKDEDFVLVENLYLGILKSDVLMMDPVHVCALHTDAHVFYRRPMDRIEDIKLTPKNIVASWATFSFSMNREPLECRNPLTSYRQKGPIFALEVVVGDDKVEAFFEYTISYERGIFKKAKQLLGRPQ